MTETSTPTKELRLALAMRGGVSLSVWIGGSCSEIDQLRTSTPGEGFWGRLLRESGYGAVAVDVLAGASAGGLNGAIYAASQQYGFGMAGLRDLWVDLGDTDRLLRTKDTARTDGWPSLFRGDEYFFEQARSALQRLGDAAERPQPAPPVLLTLSATLVEPVRRPGRSPSDEPLTHLRFASAFTFRNPRYPWQHSDFPADSAGGAVWSRLALAARSTSSFPVAFEAALVDAARPPSFIDPHVAQGQGLTIDMGGIFQDRGTSDGRTEQFIVSDGGILDNIPLGRALQGIVEAPAHGPTDRFLIYVQPGAPAPTAADTDPASLVRRRASFAVLQGLLSARMPSEDIIGDLQQLDANNVLIERAASLRRSGFGQLLSQEELLGAARVAWSGYRRLRADEDQRLVSRLLDDPLTALGEDPFPTHVGGDPVAEDRWRSPLDARRGDGGLAPLSRGSLAVALAERFHGRLPDQFPEAAGLVGVGARTLLRITQLLIEWSQHVEGSAPGAGALKGRLYRTAAFAREAIDRPRQLGWVTLAATMPDDADEDAFADGARALEHLVQLRPDEARAICDALLARDGDEVLRSGVASRMALLDTLPGRAWHTVSEPTGVVDLRNEILARVLVPTARELRALAAPTIDPATPAGYLDRALDGEITAATLAALEVVAYPEFASGLPARRPVRFQRLSAGNPTPLAPRFTSLLADARAQGKWWDPEVTDPAAQEGIHLSLKLAGNELANFSAFLRDDWRRNDWLWGRMDAVPTLVDLLLAGERFTQAHGDGVDDAWIDDLVAGPPGSAMCDFLRGDLLDDAMREAIRVELSVAGPCPTLRRVLTAARQWEILAEELLPDGGAGSDPGPALLAAVARYRTGAETIRDDGISADVRGRLSHITDVAGNVVVYCSQLQLGGRYFGEPGHPSLLGRATDKAIDWAGRFAVGRITRK